MQLETPIKLAGPSVSGERTNAMLSRSYRGRGGPRIHQSQDSNVNVTDALAVPRLLQRPNRNPATQRQPYQKPYSPPGYQQRQNFPVEDSSVQISYLDQLAAHEVSKVEISLKELEEKESFRQRLENTLQKAFVENYAGDIASINLVGFGSLASGFATPGSDMDLALVPTWKDPSKAHRIGIDREIPRLLERAVLDAKMGGRLLTRTRVPILKVCQNPSEELYGALYEERRKWDELPEDEQYPPPVAPPEPHFKPSAESEAKKLSPTENKHNDFPTLEEAKVATKTTHRELPKSPSTETDKVDVRHTASKDNENPPTAPKEHHPRSEKQWLREKVLGPLDFPKSGIGIQCDINFENPLAIHNTHLLWCYSLCDPRVRPMVLFVKAWAKQRKLNSSYSGTLSSYGWVLMVLHYLVNVVQPPVCPNLQLSWRPGATNMDDLEQMFKETTISGYLVRFWRNEEEIRSAATNGRLTQNTQSVGALLLGFFQYYASIHSPFQYGHKPPSFYWTTEVLSLRTLGGIRKKSEKGWTGAKTTYSNGKEVRHRYLFCIEDPFELDHNVARTVTHNGIVAIRDDFRRVWRILNAVGRKTQPEGGLFDEVVEKAPPLTPKPTEDEAGKPRVTEEAATNESKLVKQDEDAKGSSQVAADVEAT